MNHRGCRADEKRDRNSLSERFNRTVLEKLIKEHDLVFTELFVAKPHIFVEARKIRLRAKSL